MLKILTEKNGFSLVEILLVMAIISVIATLSIPLMQTYYSQNELKVAVDSSVQGLRRAQSYALSEYQDSNWGMHIESGRVVVFKGANYASRDQTYDETVTFGNFISIAGTTDVVFTKFTGAPSATGNLVLSINSDHVKTININSKGMVSY